MSTSRASHLWIPLAFLYLAACNGGESGTDPGPTTGAIAGSVTADGTGVPGADLNLTPGGSLSTTAGGEYRFDNLQPGDYTLAITPPSGFVLAEGEASTKSASVAAGSSATVNWSLQADSPNGGEVVEIRLTTGDRFAPDDVSISPGTTVRWINDSNMLHTVTPDDPEQPGVWTATSTSSQGVVLEHTFTVEGETYDYHCEPHLGVGMVGRIVVQ